MSGGVGSSRLPLRAARVACLPWVGKSCGRSVSRGPRGKSIAGTDDNTPKERACSMISLLTIFSVSYPQP